jgi:hypothetical protein
MLVGLRLRQKSNGEDAKGKSGVDGHGWESNLQPVLFESSGEESSHRLM